MPQYVCPNCKEGDRLAEINSIVGYALGEFDEKGRFTYLGETKVDWDSQSPISENNRYVCLACDTRFSTPAIAIKTSRSDA